MNKKTKQDLLKHPIEHLDITRYDVAPLVEAMRNMSYSARDLARAADLYDRMLADKGCAVVLCLAGSLLNAGLKKIFVEMIRCNMVDCIVSTGANIVDQDFFEALGFRHYVADEDLKTGMDDETLRQLHVDRIYDTLIDEDELRICDDTITAIANEMEPRPYSSREFILEMGQYLQVQLLRDTDAMGMRHSLEIRTPLVDRDLLRALARVPAALRRAGPAKRGLREAPRPPVPEALWRRRKQGFTLPFETWLRGGGIPMDLPQHPWLVPAAVEAVARDFRARRVHWSRLWTLLVLREFLA